MRLSQATARGVMASLRTITNVLNTASSAKANETTAALHRKLIRRHPELDQDERELAELGKVDGGQQACAPCPIR